MIMREIDIKKCYINDMLRWKLLKKIETRSMQNNLKKKWTLNKI